MNPGELYDIRTRINAMDHRIDWKASDFSLDKAYICSLFSKLAYASIPDYELKAANDRNRVKIVPCLDYQRRILSGTQTDVARLLREAEFGQYFFIQRRFIIAVGVRVNNLIIVSVRGTYELYDWLVNLNASRQKYAFVNDAKFHKGFFKAALACLQPLTTEIKKLRGSDYHDPKIPIYVTGHSLGGAMAAIINTIWDVDFNGILDPYRYYDQIGKWSHGCYTFGMPRYGNLNAITLRPPYSLYHENDIVPLVPPRFLGFESCYNEYKLDGTGLEKKSKRETLTFANWWINLVRGVGIKEHNIELYRDRIYEHLK